MKNILLFVFLAMVANVSLASRYSDTPSQGSKGKWAWGGWVSQMSFKNGTTLNVLFPPKYQCQTALFGIVSNDNIYSMSFDIDGNKYRSTSPENIDIEGRRVSSFPLSKSALRQLKNGSHLEIDIGFGTINAGLSGSALAFNSAFGNCMKELEGTTSQPSRIAKQQELSREKPNKITTIREDGHAFTIFNGEFEVGDGQKIIQEMQDTGSGILLLNSTGGIVSEAQMAGYFIRSNNLNTMVGGTCASACIFALAGGVARYSMEDSRVGVHQTKFANSSGSLSQGQQVVSNYLRYFKSMDIDSDLVAIASSTSSDDMHWLTKREMTDLNLITELIQDD